MLDMSVAFARPRLSLFDEPHEPLTIPGSAEVAHSVQLHQVPALAAAAVTDRIDDPRTVPEWSEAAIVQLHWVLLRELAKLQDPETPLEEKLDTLDWALTDPARDNEPFSFANCLRVVGTSPLSPTPYFGLLQVDEIREWLLVNARKWLRQTIARYPEWVQELIRSQPHVAARELLGNPQWINEQIKAREAAMQPAAQQPDLFGVGASVPVNEEVPCNAH